jgi:hypothetical protein
MAKMIVRIVTSCFHCPDVLDRYVPARCQLAELNAAEHRILDQYPVIPVWCPLPDMKIADKEQ